MSLSFSKNVQTYHAQVVHFARLVMPDTQSVFKVYFLSIIGRASPEQYEWAQSPFSQSTFLQNFSQSGAEGIGFVISFPHVTKIYRFSPEKETILDVSEHHTPDLSPRDLSRGDTFHELGCFAEVILAADEYNAWARAASVEEYLEFRSVSNDFPVIRQDKLYTYWESGKL